MPRNTRWMAPVIIPLLLESCSVGPRTVVLPAPGTLPERRELEIWSGDRAVTWHGLVITTDSITGVPIRLAPDCGTCRLALPRTSVDSVREVHTDKALLTTVGLVGSLAVVTLLVWNSQSE